MSFSTIRLSAHAGIAEVRLARPDAGNPIDDRFLGELERACTALHDDPSVRVVLLTAEGGIFSAGGDARPPEGTLALRCIEAMSPPVIACLEGDAAGAGLELALACDVRVAAEDARFSMPQAAAGGLPRLGGTQRLARAAGRARALELLLLGETIDGRTAAAWGLVNAALPRGETRARSEALASAIAARGPLAVRYAKEAALRGADLPLDQALRYETDLTVILQTTADRAEGVRAFIEKREPRFEGK
ncbi:MAG: enoyl-CoA hydratase/isomerase family protein [Dehalococcoidia bacterium]